LGKQIKTKKAKGMRFFDISDIDEDAKEKRGGNNQKLLKVEQDH